MRVIDYGCGVLWRGRPFMAHCGNSWRCSRTPAIEVEADGRRTRAEPPLKLCELAVITACLCSTDA